MKKFYKIIFAAVLFLTLSSCSMDDGKIHGYSREFGSGTRSVFSEKMGLVKNGYDAISEKISVTNSGIVMLSAVAGDKNAVGYVSAATVNDKVKVVSLDGVYPNQQNITNGKYPLARKFILVYYPDRLDDTQNEFLKFLQGDTAAQIITDMGYICNTTGENYQKTTNKGKLVIAGSASVAPLMDRLRQSFSAGQNFEIEIQQNDSTTGLALLSRKLCDIAMVSRDIQMGELKPGYKTIDVAFDAIAVIVHPQNPVKNLNKEQVSRIFSSDEICWNDV